MATLAFERGASTLGQQLAFENELREIIEVAGQNGAARDAGLRQRLAQAWIRLRVMRLHALRSARAAARGACRRRPVSKLYWCNWHRDLGELAMDVLGAGTVPERALRPARLQRLFLFTRADTIYGGHKPDPAQRDRRARARASAARSRGRVTAHSAAPATLRPAHGLSPARPSSSPPPPAPASGSPPPAAAPRRAPRSSLSRRARAPPGRGRRARGAARGTAPAIVCDVTARSTFGASSTGGRRAWARSTSWSTTRPRRDGERWST